MTKSLSLFLAFQILLAPVASLAQEAAPTRTLRIEQSSMGALGELTLILPTQAKITLTSPYELPDPYIGKYTLFIAAPKGHITTVDVYDGTTLLQTVSQPQVSFDVADASNIKIIVSYTLLYFGKVGVSTNPAGVPFTLHGPNGLTKEGITPENYDNLPIGEYVVNYRPQGCPEMPAKSDTLVENKQIYLKADVHCDSFEPVAKPDSGNANEMILFDDVDAGDWFAPSVYRMVQLGLVSGYKDESGNLTGKFGPGNSVTLAELAKIMVAMMGIDDGGYVKTYHPSASGTWFERYVAIADDRNWVVYTDPDIDLNRPATRGEIVETLLQALDLPLNWPKGGVFGDVTGRTKYAAAIETAKALGLVEGNDDGFFGPLDPINRAELSKILAIAMEKYRSKEESSSQ